MSEIDLGALLATGLAFFIVTVSPGPATLSNATIAMSHGRTASLVYGAGLSCGLIFWGLIAASGMGAILQSSIYLLSALKVVGGLYLLWLAYLSARSAWTQAPGGPVVVHQQKWFIKGLLLNISNPKSVVAWMAALSIGLDPDDGFWAIVAATTVCIVVGFLANALYSVLFSLEGMMRAYQRCKRWISGAVAGLFAFAGMGLIRSALSR
ncbi:LysE family translocator [Motiliproteus sp.]|uniref:LysE family translocator n=1 Tax=Motiliproteus sp. TaxID=1898955 RepID=UPI003BAB33D5